jgi:hypothetical protein
MGADCENQTDLLFFITVQLTPVVALANTQRGIASVYSTESGSRTASGVRLNPGALTAAHRLLPFGSKVRVTRKTRHVTDFGWFAAAVGRDGLDYGRLNDV